MSINKNVTMLEIGERGSQISVRITYKGKDYDGYLTDVEESD